MPDGGQPNRQVIAARSLAFNLAPVGYVHPSWYRALKTGSAMEACANIPDLRAPVSEALLEHFGLHRDFVLDFSEPRARLVLLDRALVENLFLYVGAALRSRELRAVLDGRRVSYLRREIGPGAYDFATKRAQLLGPVLDFTYGAGDDGAAGNPREALLRTGAAYALSPRAVAEPGYLQRAALMLPIEAGKRLLEDMPVAETPDGADLPPLVRRIIKEFGSRWLPFFD